VADINERLDRLQRREEFDRFGRPMRHAPAETTVGPPVARPAGVDDRLGEVLDAVASVVRRHPGLSVMVALADGRAGRPVIRVTERDGGVETGVVVVATAQPRSVEPTPQPGDRREASAGYGPYDGLSHRAAAPTRESVPGSDPVFEPAFRDSLPSPDSLPSRDSLLAREGLPARDALLAREGLLARADLASREPVGDGVASRDGLLARGGLAAGDDGSREDRSRERLSHDEFARDGLLNNGLLDNGLFNDGLSGDGPSRDSRPSEGRPGDGGLTRGGLPSEGLARDGLDPDGLDRGGRARDEMDRGGVSRDGGSADGTPADDLQPGRAPARSAAANGRHAAAREQSPRAGSSWHDALWSPESRDRFRQADEDRQRNREEPGPAAGSIPLGEDTSQVVSRLAQLLRENPTLAASWSREAEE
jgi:hypothetical protein